jgi:hypothetical protein
MYEVLQEAFQEVCIRLPHSCPSHVPACDTSDALVTSKACSSALHHYLGTLSIDHFPLFPLVHFIATCRWVVLTEPKSFEWHNRVITKVLPSAFNDFGSL